jgi:uncharacterized 2Fe-2S/4Fe-4S cluster protein (DUF4445 family)
MSHDQHRVTFQPQGRVVSVLDGTTILEAAASAGLVIDTPCGGKGTCGKCRVQIAQGADEAVETDGRFLADREIQDGWRLACRCAIHHDLVVAVPASSLFGQDPQIRRDATVGDPDRVVPAVQKIYVELVPPTLEDPVADLVRLEERVGPFRVDIAMLRHVPHQLRLGGFKGTAVLADRTLIDFEDGDTTARCFGIAVDVGTTTIVASLLSLCSGQELAVVSRMNPQAMYGDDVLSRIKHASTSPACLDQLRRSVVDEVASMVGALCAEAGVRAQQVYEITFAGNTTMQHILCGVDPAQLGASPFAPAYARGLLLGARDLEIPINPRGMAYVFPSIGGFIGGDTVAGMLCTRIETLASPALMIDVGTNGEIVLAHDGALTTASTAAGPAFEGARISCGMRGMRGAVEKVVLDDDVRVGVIGDAQPVGICGSGLIDLVAELLRVGIVSMEGRLLEADELPAGLPPKLADRVRRAGDGQTIFVLAESTRAGRTDVVLTQRDVRELQLGCGAIRAGISIMLRQAGLAPSDLATVLIAGGFGSFIRRDKAQRIGLIPAVDRERVQYVGNASLAGARWALLSVDARKHGEELARRARHVELSIDPRFQDEFVDAMIFPEPPQG